MGCVANFPQLGEFLRGGKIANSVRQIVADFSRLARFSRRGVCVIYKAASAISTNSPADHGWRVDGAMVIIRVHLCCVY
jgi:hypothetical protein